MGGKPKGRDFTLNMRTSKPPSKPRPAPGLCRECFELERMIEPPPVSTVTIHEIHYHHTYICQHGQHCTGRAANPPQEQAFRRRAGRQVLFSIPTVGASTANSNAFEKTQFL
ncbi:hypothetical protein O988_01023 [Pseudogymnoascus sp. VKM F-3808]|nr:hypothetical protein O988_01023 [Pseudogymnoascus sp. VKM F-3808]